MTVTIDLKPLKRFQRQLKNDLRGSGQGPVRAAMKQWGARYRAFVQRRFKRNSRGGGGWPPLAASTIRRRRGKRSKVAILIDTGTLFRALDPVFNRKPGQIQEDIPFGVRVGYGGPGQHPSGKLTVADIAEFHQKGGGHLPQRKIIVPPDANTTAAMRRDMERALKRMIDSTGNGPGRA